MSHGIGWSCRIEWSNGSEPSLNKEPLHDQITLYGIGWSYGIEMLCSGLGLGLESLCGIGWSYDIGLSYGIEVVVGLHTESPLDSDR